MAKKKMRTRTPEPGQQERYFSIKQMGLESHTITREEYYRRTENAERPYHDGGMQLRSSVLKKRD